MGLTVDQMLTLLETKAGEAPRGWRGRRQTAFHLTTPIFLRERGRAEDIEGARLHAYSYAQARRMLPRYRRMLREAYEEALAGREGDPTAP